MALLQGKACLGVQPCRPAAGRAALLPPRPTRTALPAPAKRRSVSVLLVCAEPPKAESGQGPDSKNANAPASSAGTDPTKQEELPTVALAQATSKWIDRPKPTNAILTYLGEPPRKILCILGHRNSGKSRLIAQLCKTSLADQAMLFNCRKLDTSSPDTFAGDAFSEVHAPLFLAAGLPAERASAGATGEEVQPRRNLQDVLWLIPAFLKVTTSGMAGQLNVDGVAELMEKATEINMEEPEKPKDSASTVTSGPSAMANLLRRLEQFSDMWWKLGWLNELGYPVIIIDEANLLYAWQNSFSGDLQVLKSYLVYLTKECLRCHVILVSSDFGFLNFLEAPPAGIFNDWFDVLLVNGFEENEAKCFFWQQLEAMNLGDIDDMLDDEAWKRVYEVCGGNPQYMASCAKCLAKGGSLNNGLDAVQRDMKAAICKVIGDEMAPTPLRLPYAKLVSAMLASPSSCGISLDWAVGHVLQEPFLQLPEREDRINVVRQLTAANLLTTRPCSLAEEQSPELFNKGSGFAIFPPGRAMLTVMKSLEPALRIDWEIAEKQWKEEKQREKQRKKQQEEREKQQEELRKKREKLQMEYQALEMELKATPIWQLKERGQLLKAMKEKAQQLAA